MSDNIPFDIQIEIIKKVSNVKSLIQFRTVSKQWRSFIDSPDFIKGYGACHTQPHSHILKYRSDAYSEEKYICLVDDDLETFKVQQQDCAPFVVSPLLKEYNIRKVVGECHGLLCFYGFYKDTNILVIWNPAIGKSFGIVVPEFNRHQPWNGTSYCFGVCPITSDPTVVKFVCAVNMPWHVEVFRLSSGVWNVIPRANLPPRTCMLKRSTQVVIDKFIYRGVREWTGTDYCDSIVSFDLISEEFKVVNPRDTLTNKLISCVSLSKLRGSLVVCGKIVGKEGYGVWVMENDSSFRKLFTIGAPLNKILDKKDEILGFKKNGEIIFNAPNEFSMFKGVLEVYDPYSQQIKNLGISGLKSSFFMGSYKESLLSLDSLDSLIYFDTDQNDDGPILRRLFCS